MDEMKIDLKCPTQQNKPVKVIKDKNRTLQVFELKDGKDQNWNILQLLTKLSKYSNQNVKYIYKSQKVHRHLFYINLECASKDKESIRNNKFW